jgi:hypothetical protein
MALHHRPAWLITMASGRPQVGIPLHKEISLHGARATKIRAIMQWLPRKRICRIQALLEGGEPGSNHPQRRSPSKARARARASDAAG